MYSIYFVEKKGALHTPL